MDHGFAIEEIHEMLDSVDRSITKLRDANLYNKRMPVTFISDGVSAIYELDDAQVLGHTGINASLARKLKNLNGTLPASVMLSSMERVRTYLRRIESEFGGGSNITEDDERLLQLDSVVERNPPEPVPVWAEQWVYVKPGSRVKQIISDISELLDEVLVLVKSTNLPENDAAITDIERAQLVALLETALHMLRAPMVEPGLLKKLGKAASTGAEKAAERGVEQATGEALRALVRKLLSLPWL